MGVHTTRKAIGTSTGNVDITITGIGTPVAAMLFLTSGVTNGAEANHNMLCVGMTDGTNHRAACVTSENGVATTNTWNKIVNDSPLISLNANSGAIDGAVDTCSFITDGIRLHVSDAFPASYLVTVILWVPEGSGYYVKVGSFTGSSTSSVTVSDVGGGGNFEPDQIFTVGVGETYSSGFTGIATTAGDANNNMGIGFLDNQGTDVRRCINWFEEDAYATGGGGNHSHSDIEQGGVFSDAGLGSEVVDITATGTGFNVSASSGFVAYLAISYRGNNQHAAGDIATPTSTGSQAVTGVGFQPHFVLELQSWLTAYNTPQNSNGWSYGLGILSNDSQTSPPDFETWDYDHDVAGRSDNSANPTVTKGYQARNQVTRIREPNISSTITATLTSLDADGYTKNFTTVAASAMKGSYIAVGPAPAGHPARRRMAQCEAFEQADESVRVI